ncbi:hypothetical protein SAMN05421664_1562 [Chryseobacterium soldanellicola]|uniref:Uncharacterized protein n=1 Tax=Chryseobacterium soldanellicola TaxID=311333 RepID=A0A1H1AS66_9FLAO|nr:hypothetical protein [Chryseobacterium soldanellicola]SDQ42573.1 hypothetical protein SAMN05421664_1562 [Chryseobacterium soldanellicola]
MDFFTIYLKNNDLVIENSFTAQKIRLDSIDDVIIFSAQERGRFKVFIFTTLPIITEAKSETFINKLVFSAFKTFNKNSNEIKTHFEEKEVNTLLKILADNLDNVMISNDLEGSLLWRETDNGFTIKGIKLIYSKNKLGLAEVLKKHNILR